VASPVLAGLQQPAFRYQLRALQQARLQQELPPGQPVLCNNLV
jgi:hypothetical protein